MSDSESQSEPKAPPAETGAESSPAPIEPDLREALETSRRHASELTQQSLGFLREIGRLRQVEMTLTDTLERLESNRLDLAVARRIIRNNHVDLLRPSPNQLTGRLAVVIWGGVPTSAYVAAVTAALSEAVPMTCLVTEGVRPADLPESVAWVEGLPVLSLGHAVNYGLALTQADAVLFLHVSSMPQAGGWETLPVMAEDTLFVQPLIEDDEGASLGQQIGEDLLRLARAPWTAEGESKSDLCVVDGIDPRAFVMCREAAAAVGPFPAEILGPLSLVEVLERARGLGYRALGLPEMRVRAEVTSLRVDETVADRDRLLMVARHRPESLGSAFVRAEFLWEIESADRRAFFHSVAQRLPEAHRWPEGIGFVVETLENAMQVAVSPAERRRADDQSRERLMARVEALVAEFQASPDPSLRGLTTRLAEVATVSVVGEQAERVAGVEVDARKHLTSQAEEQRAEREAMESRQHAEREEMASRQRAADQSLAAAREELKLAQDALAVEREALAAERIAHDNSREEVRQAWRAVAQELSAIRGHSLLAGDLSPGAPLPPMPFEALDAAASTLREAAGEDGDPVLPALLDRFLDCIHRLSRDCGQARDQLAETSQEVERLRSILAEREEWIAQLLPAATRRRLRPRPMADHEADFLDRYQRRKS